MAQSNPNEQRLKDTSFIDIEVIPRESDYEQYADLYYKRFKREIDAMVELQNPLNQEPYKSHEDATGEHFLKNAGLYAEFGQIISIAVGKVGKANSGKLYIKIMAGTDEKALLAEAKETIKNSECSYLCAHNGLDYDFPVMMRSYLRNGMEVPQILNTQGKKTWEVPLVDTMELWAGTQWKYKASLDLLCMNLNVPSPKQSEVTGKNLYEFYCNPELTLEEKLKAIGQYNGGDVAALTNVFCRLKGLPIIAAENIEYSWWKNEATLFNQ